MKGFLKVLRLIPFGVRFVVKALVKIIFNHRSDESINIDIDGDGVTDIVISTPRSKREIHSHSLQNHKEEKDNDSN